MLLLRRSPESIADLLAISERIALDNPSAAYRWLDNINGTIELLASFPTIGEAVPRYGSRVRRLTQGAYVLFFRSDGSELELLRVLHGSRDIEQLFE